LLGPDILRHEADNPEFIEDRNLFTEWINNAIPVGLRVRAGRWNIPCRPKVVLIDFSGITDDKNKIFKDLWETYGVDSLHGQWDYVEPTIFGYAAGMIIESFVKYYIDQKIRLVAHFHEWMTGSGILYLKKNFPQIGTVFTTHATITGRTLTGNNQKLYKNLSLYNSDNVARDFNIVSKHSMEKASAQQADMFTTVSEITANECKLLLNKDVDIITHNGIDPDMIPDFDSLKEKKQNARKVLIEMAKSITGENIPDDIIISGTSGRYEYRTKGLDVYINALGELNKKGNTELLAYFFIPAHNYGPIYEKFKTLELGKRTECKNYLSHNLHNEQHDPILNAFKKANLTNCKHDKVKVIFVPSYLFGNDGVFNMEYYDLLAGLDISVFASYYEPWGYTPLESLAYCVPSVNTTLCGFAHWIDENYKGDKSGITIINRNDDNDLEVTENICDAIIKFSEADDDEKRNFQVSARNIAIEASWDNLFKEYIRTYENAVDIAIKRKRKVLVSPDISTKLTAKRLSHYVSTPRWRNVIVKLTIPEKLKPLHEIANNIWWSWNDNAKELFKNMDSELWKTNEHNPIKLFNQISYKRLKELGANSGFMDKVSEVYSDYQKYMNVDMSKEKPHIAYFSMEYGFHQSIKIYSGGLGILAGDYLKEASDRKTNIVGIGLLYRYGYFKQKLSFNGTQQSIQEYQKFTDLPIKLMKDVNGNPLYVNINFPGRVVHIRIWELKVGRINVYLLDTDFGENHDEDQRITHQLYGGDNENRLKQEIVLGIGGIRALRALNIKPDIYHLNEGHSAFIGFERLRYFIQEKNLTFSEAEELVRSSSLFTTHTPVAAGHDEFDESLIRIYMSHYPARLNLTWQQFLGLGRISHRNANTKFNMSYLACHLSQEVNGVSMLHGDVSKKMFSGLWQGYLPEELHINYVTNGVHVPTWTAKEWKRLFKTISNDQDIDLSSNECFNMISSIPANQIWLTKQYLKKKLIKYIRSKLQESLIMRHEDPKIIVNMQNKLDEKILTIVFARRFATYKRAHLLFHNEKRLEAIINNPEKPIQLIFAGKAHPNDKAGQDLIKMIIEFSRKPQFQGRILFLEDYNMYLAKLLVHGADIWLNTPTRPLEASGTSGQKAVMNGTLHFSVLDGWWVEGYQENAGWSLPMERTYDNQTYQDEFDAESIYHILEDEIAPTFYEYKYSDMGYSDKWVNLIKNSFSQVAPMFTTKRMLNDYQNKFYKRLYERYEQLKVNNYEKAFNLSEWKHKLLNEWRYIRIMDFRLIGNEENDFHVGNIYSGELDVRIKNINPEDIGIDLIVSNCKGKIVDTYQAELISMNEEISTWGVTASLSSAGSFNLGFRVYPRNPLLPHRMDFPLVKWI
jgi:phosphorylase/glycogen(starch) synthase